MNIWSELYKSDTMPNFQQISTYINNPFFNYLCNFIETTYKIEPLIEHSTCSMLPGWNIKYKKNNKSICTLYPNKNFFTCMFTVNNKIQEQIEYMLPSCTSYIQNLYKTTSSFNNCKWLMIDITEINILNDTKELIKLKIS